MCKKSFRQKVSYILSKLLEKIMIYGAEGAAILSADIVFNVGTDSYVCKFDPTMADRTPSAIPLEEQPIWSITLYQNTITPEGHSRMNTLYPNGSNAYKFVAAHYLNYNYKFRL